MNEAVLFDTVWMTTLIVGLWYWHREKAGIRRLLHSWGLPVALDAENIPVLEPSAPEVAVTAGRAQVDPTRGLRLSVDLVARGRLAKKGAVLLGLLGPEDEALPVPPGIRWVRFRDALETLGGEVATPFATKSEMLWEDVHLWVPAAALPAPPAGPVRVRVEVWIDGDHECDVTLSLPLQR